MTTTAFTAGSITLSGWVSETTGNSPTASFVIGTNIAAYDFDWTAATSVTNNGGMPGSPQQISASDNGSGDQATLAIANTDASVTLEAGNGTPLLKGAGTLTLDGTSAGVLQTEIRTLQVLDSATDDSFSLQFTLTDVTATAARTFTENFFAVCYSPGTRIATPAGETTVEDLRIGDLVLTAAGEAKPVKWIGRRGYSAAAVAQYPNLRPVLIRQDALAPGLPRRDLMLSPMHALFIDGVFIPAVALVNGVSILRRTEPGRADYIHVELDSHDVILAEGVPAESFVDDNSRTLFENVSESYDLYGTAEPPRGFSAPRVEEGYRLETVRRRIAARAGIAAVVQVPGELAGHVERVQAGGVLEGWVTDPTDPAQPVELEVLVDGALVATVLANRYRVDLDRAGLAGGRCGFTVTLPAASAHARIEVRRAADGRALPMPQPAREPELAY